MKRLIAFLISGAFVASAAARPAAAAEIFLPGCSGSNEIGIVVSYQEQSAIDVTAPLALVPGTSLESTRTESLIATGPILGTMDSHDLHFETKCVRGTVEVTATVTRSSEYGGAVLKFTTWRPIVRVERPSAAKKSPLRLTWRMVSSAGTEIEEGDLPGSPTQHFPVTLKYPPR